VISQRGRALLTYCGPPGPAQPEWPKKSRFWSCNPAS